ETRTRAAASRAALQRGAPPDRSGEAPGTRETAAERPYATFAQYARDALITRVDRIGAIVGPELRQRAAERLERAAQVHTLTSDVPGLIPDQHLAQIFEV